MDEENQNIENEENVEANQNKENVAFRRRNKNPGNQSPNLSLKNQVRIKCQVINPGVINLLYHIAKCIAGYKYERHLVRCIPSKFTFKFVNEIHLKISLSFQKHTK